MPFQPFLIIVKTICFNELTPPPLKRTITCLSDSELSALDFQNKIPTVVIIFMGTSAGLEYNFTRPDEIKSTYGNVHNQVNLRKICSVIAYVGL